MHAHNDDHRHRPGPHAHQGHGHHGHHGQLHADLQATNRRALVVGIVLNTGFVIVEAIAGWMTGSLALLSDAGHNLGDVAGLILAWAAAWATGLGGTDRKTWGWRRLSILAALGNAVLILAAMGAIGWEAVRRLGDPAPIAGTTVMIVAAIGVGINAITALMLAAGSRGDLNIRAAFLHMVSDAVVSVGVVAVGAVYLLTGWHWLDPAASLAIAAVIVWATWGLLRQSLHLSLDGVPASIDLDSVRATLTRLPGVASVHDLHVWAISTSQTALTAHLVVPGLAGSGDPLIARASRQLHEQFGIDHVTLQLESDAATCSSGASCDDTALAGTEPR